MQNIDNFPKIQQHIQRMGFSGTVGTKEEWLSFIDELNNLLADETCIICKKDIKKDNARICPDCYNDIDG